MNFHKPEEGVQMDPIYEVVEQRVQVRKAPGVDHAMRNAGKRNAGEPSVPVLIHDFLGLRS